MNGNILIAGVGGQGQVLASRLIGTAAIAGGLRARTSETIGMSQRGGCVTSNVRVGDAYSSPAVPCVQAGLLIGFEICEAARNLGKLAPDGAVVLNDYAIRPVTVSLGLQKYDPEALKEEIRHSVRRLLVLDGISLAQKAGSVKACNVVLLGACVGAGFLSLSRALFMRAIDIAIPERYRELNIRAFTAGYDYAKGYAQ